MSSTGDVPSAAAWAAAVIASAVAGPPTNAASTADARIGTGPMLVSPTLASATFPPSTRTAAATETIDQDWATRWNFS